MAMRITILTMAACCILPGVTRAADLPQFADAPLRAVQFVDANEGWAAGDDGVILHTIDGGETWERQPSGVRASLRSIHFLDPFRGYVVGRESMPFGANSAGVILFTDDGGVRWQRVSVRELPGLNRVKFFDARRGIVAGDGSDRFPSGLFATEDSGVTWKGLPGPRTPGWLAADFTDASVGVLGGPWGGVAPLRNLEFLQAEVDALAPRAIRDLKLHGRTAWAVGDGGLLLVSAETVGKKWAHADLELPPEVKRAWDFHAMCWLGDGEHAWIVGRPGSLVLHTWDGGRSWQAQQTGQPLPLHGVHFVNQQQGWAVGELGTILATRDGGRTWKAQRRGGQRAAVLWITSRSTHVAPGVLAMLGGGDQGYLCTAIGIASADPASAPPGQANDAQRLNDAVRLAGGCSGDVLWHFPLPAHHAQSNATELAKLWGGSHDEARGLAELERQIVLAIRTWQPEVIITDHPDPRSSTGHAGALVTLVVKKAFEQAGKADCHPEQIAKLDLQPWDAKKLYARCDAPEQAQVVLDLEIADRVLGGTPNDVAGEAWNLLSPRSASAARQACFGLLASRIDNAELHKGFLDGLTLGQGGQARREATPFDPQSDAKWAQTEQAIKRCRDTQALAKLSLQDTTRARQVIAALERSLAGLNEDQGGQAAFAMGTLYANVGQWVMAKEVYLYRLDKYPAHRRSAEACRWLIQHGASSEARRREELNHFVATRSYDFSAAPGGFVGGEGPESGRPSAMVNIRKRANSLLLRKQDEVQNWNQRSLALSELLASFGPLHVDDPQVQFCLQSARRTLGQTDEATLWYTQFKTAHTSGPWYDAAATELWLRRRQGMAPKPIANCPAVTLPPYLDGRLDDPCWRDAKPMVLKDAVAATADSHPTEAWLAYDAEYLYVALRCQHPEGAHVPPVKPRSRDADLRSFDRVSLTLDLDRDYTTCFQFQVDQRGCVHEDCWGDATWDPKWHVAVHSDEKTWQIEAAIPMKELSLDPVKAGHIWACNLVRTIPGKGVQAFSTPAEAHPRPEGMGLLQFDEPVVTAEKQGKQIKTAEKK
jgi:photosystem II stability/assembly factor-like uncharacterized protein